MAPRISRCFLLPKQLFKAAERLNEPRSGATVTPLSTNETLGADGFSGSAYLGTAELFDPATRTLTVLTARMTTPRAIYTAIMLDGRFILAAGGESGASSPLSPQDWAPLASADLYALVRHQFEPLRPIGQRRSLHRATRTNKSKAHVRRHLRGLGLLELRALRGAGAKVYGTSSDGLAALAPRRPSATRWHHSAHRRHLQ